MTVAPFSKFAPPHCINQYLSSLSAYPHPTLIDASDAEHTHSLLCFDSNLTPSAERVGKSADGSCARPSTDWQSCYLISGPLRRTAGVGCDCWNEMLFCCNLWTLLHSLRLRGCPWIALGLLALFLSLLTSTPFVHPYKEFATLSATPNQLHWSVVGFWECAAPSFICHGRCSIEK